jgi:hypothetical protein
MWWLAALVALCQFSSVEAEALEVRVRAQSVLDADVTTAGTSVHVTGALRDELDRGLPQRRVYVSFSPKDTRAADEAARDMVYTDRRGGFTLARELAPGRWSVDIAFEETEHVTASQTRHEIEVEPAPVDLRIQGPELVVGEVDSVGVRARANVAGVGLKAPAHVLVDGEGLATIELDQFGRGIFDVAAGLSPGINDIVVRIAATEHREAVEAALSIRYSESLQVSAEFEEVVERLQRGLGVRGVIADGLGPIEGARVRVEIFRRGDERVDADEGDGAAEERAAYQRFVTSGPEGRFVAFFAGDDLEDGVWSAQTTIVPPVGDEIEVSTEPVEFDRTTTRWLLNVLGLIGLLGALGLVVQRLWQVIGARLARRRRRRDSRERAEQAFSETEAIELRPLGAQVPPVEREPDRLSISGVVWDVWRDVPVAGATLRISADAELVREVTTADSEAETLSAGAFLVEELQAGSYQLEVSADGFMTGRLRFELPHRGQLSNTRLDLIAVPLKIRRLYESLIATLRGEELWGRLSPRQIEQTLLEASKRAAQAQQTPGSRAFVASLERKLDEQRGQLSAEELVAMMTAVVEETYFSGRTFDESVWRLAREIAVDLRASFEEVSP